MPDELVERLRAVKDWWRAPGLLAEQAADRIEELEASVAALKASADEMGVALQHAANTFYRYAKLHRAKGTDEGDAKACDNASMGEEMNAALTAYHNLGGTNG